MATKSKTRESLAGTWIHPADGDNYPTELIMKVTEIRGIGVLGWETSVDYGDVVSTCQYAHAQGSHAISFAVKGPDGAWSPSRVMSSEQWFVESREHAMARRVMERFFTAAGYMQRKGNGR